MSANFPSRVTPTTSAAPPVVDPEKPGYFVAGSGDGAAVVMLHSSLASKAQWTTLAERLATRYRVIDGRSVSLTAGPSTRRHC